LSGAFSEGLLACAARSKIGQAKHNRKSAKAGKHQNEIGLLKTRHVILPLELMVERKAEAERVGFDPDQMNMTVGHEFVTLVLSYSPFLGI
jgi:hypothetical protein